MPQKIRIYHNGPIEEFEMEVNEFNLVIGEQATGKSTIAKSIYFFRYIKTMVIDYLTQLYDEGTYKGKDQYGKYFYEDLNCDLNYKFLQLFDNSIYLNSKFNMSYVFAEDISVQVSKGWENLYINIDYSKWLCYSIQEKKREIDLLRKERLEKTYRSIALDAEGSKSVHQEIIDSVNKIFHDDKETYYIPAGRNILTVLSKNRSSMNSMPNIDLITENFMKQVDRVRNIFSGGIRKADQSFQAVRPMFDSKKMAEWIIRMEKGEYCNNDGQEYLILDDRKQKAYINYASSGQQEILWILNFLYALMLRQEKAFVIIEEPEANIYPTLQKEVVEFICTFANITSGDVFVTTHSPYVLTAFNNLYYAGVLADETAEKEKIYEIVNKQMLIGKNELSAVKLNRGAHDSQDNGSVNLIEEYGREIRAELIDDVSSQINQTYTALYKIEMENGD